MEIIKKIFITIFIFSLTFLYITPTYCYQENNITINDIIIDFVNIEGKTYIELDKTIEILEGEKSIIDNVTKVTFNKSSKISNAIKIISPSVVSIIGSMRNNEYNNYNRYVENVIHGTGVIVEENGLILTNNHVIENMDNVLVVLSSGKGYKADIECTDEKSDLAVIKINAKNLKPVEWNEEIEIGNEVIAVGTPISMEFRNSATYGIVSGLNRGTNSSYYLIQTDAAINPGNSGGPLLSLDGKVLGINSSKYIGYGVESIGFSIPANTVKYFLSQYYTNGKVIQAEIGAKLKESWEAKTGLPSDKGLFIDMITSNLDEGIQVGDELVSINNKTMNCLTDYYEEMKNYSPGDSVKVKIRRDNIIFSTSITLSEGTSN